MANEPTSDRSWSRDGVRNSLAELVFFRDGGVEFIGSSTALVFIDTCAEYVVPRFCFRLRADKNKFFRKAHRTTLELRSVVNVRSNRTRLLRFCLFLP